MNASMRCFTRDASPQPCIPLGPYQASCNEPLLAAQVMLWITDSIRQGCPIMIIIDLSFSFVERLFNGSNDTTYIRGRVDTPSQPVPILAVRLTATSLVPPIQSGMWGFAGFGEIEA